ncbi:calcium/sodium antiporter [Hoeflea prorocentri]|uniref:Calcium/sodium antiporter n=1 Tax=Hoeflea prorocentri TaxID=1922333 RepID=A0A9X3ZGD0_9HYPH|nr:calcium/sodium antiporter [Hoeflea prorocentri]MCY6380099.1 calcium/sodium antiporter [Hoeflea prorocentri]MDA5397899.1 calcium/sodium antiporter [Hoeflea prorocentri]
MISFLILIAGLALLLFAGDYLVRGAVSLAEKLGISPLVIGLTIVAFGTSAPELLVSLKAAFTGVYGIAIGNVVGSNIANVLLVLGAPALIAPIACKEKGIGFSLFIMALLTVVLMTMMGSGILDHVDGLILLLILIFFLSWQFIRARRDRVTAALGGDYHDELDELPAENSRIAAYLLFGLIGLPVGASLTVNGAVDIARVFGVSETIIGLTIVAIGTSLPELVTTVMAAWRGSGAVAIGNVVGSNIFNMAAILGITSLVHPLYVPSHIVHIDMWIMAITSALLILWSLLGKSITRVHGVVMLALFVTYVVAVF